MHRLPGSLKAPGHMVKGKVHSSGSAETDSESQILDLHNAHLGRGEGLCSIHKRLWSPVNTGDQETNLHEEVSLPVDPFILLRCPHALLVSITLKGGD